nr:unnamed protein product [Callosobruchus analis]
MKEIDANNQIANANHIFIVKSVKYHFA